MKRLIPILSIIVAAAALVTAMIGLITVCISVTVAALGLFAVPVALVGAWVSAVSTVITAFFRRDKLCRIAFFIDLGALLISVVSITVWLTAL